MLDNKNKYELLNMLWSYMNGYSCCTHLRVDSTWNTNRHILKDPRDLRIYVFA